MDFICYKEIVQLLNKYFEAVNNADIDKLKTIFHENASMYGYLGDNPVIGTPQIFYEDLSSKPSMVSEGIDCQMVIKNIDICGGIASASILVNNFFGAFKIEDQFHLLKVDGSWKIMCKTFTTIN